jgi:uncharacterized membrane protein
MSVMTGLLLRYAPFAAGAALLAVLVHILAVLAMPTVALRNAWRILAAKAEGAGHHLLPAARPGSETTPFADPAMATAICRFDLSDGPFRIRASMGDAFTSLVILSSTGAVVHGVSDKAAQRRLLDVVLATDQQIRQLESQDPEDRVVQEIRLRLPAPQGIAVLRSLAARPSDARAAMDVVRRMQCATAAEP